MKIRLGFVSNSSSSSYTCDVCKNTESGMDLSLGDAEMYQCVNGHTFCEKHEVEFDFDTLPWQAQRDALASTLWGDRKELLLAIKSEAAYHGFLNEQKIEDVWEYVEGDIRYSAPVPMCPICQFQAVHVPDTLAYLLKTAGKDKLDVLAEIEQQFAGDYATFKEWLRE